MAACSVAQLCPTLCDPMVCTRLLCPRDSPGKNPGVGSHALLQGIFLTQRSNLGLLHCRQTFYRTSHQGISKKGNAKECSNYCTIALVSHASKLMIKILQARLQQHIVNFQMFTLVLEKAEEPEIKLPTSAGSSKKQESSRKTSTSVLLTTPKSLTVWITTNCGKLFNRWKDQTMPLEKSVCGSRSNS